MVVEEIEPTTVRTLSLKFEMSTVVFYATAGMIIDLADRLLPPEIIIEVTIITVLLVMRMAVVRDGEVVLDLPTVNKDTAAVTGREVRAQEDVKPWLMLSLSYLDETHTTFQICKSSLALNSIETSFHGLKASSMLVVLNQKFSSLVHAYHWPMLFKDRSLKAFMQYHYLMSDHKIVVPYLFKSLIVKLEPTTSALTSIKISNLELQ